MSDTKKAQAPDSGESAFLERWSRRKARARAEAGAAEPEEAPEAPAGRPADTAPPAGPGAPLPDLDSLDADSDYSAFMAAGIDESLKREALRKLFRSPKFNVIDGLDDYCRDYTQWEKLGDVVTADMRHRLERLARLAESGPETPDTAADDGRTPAAPGHTGDRHVEEIPDDDAGDQPA